MSAAACGAPAVIRPSCDKSAPARQARKPRAVRAVPSAEVEVVDRAQEAQRLRVAGRDWSEVARVVGYISAEVAQMAVTAYLQKAAVGRAPELRQVALRLELDRLEAMHAAFWPRVLEGDVKAAGVVIKLMDRRARLLGLDGAQEAFRPVQSSIVIGGGDDMADQLRQAALAVEVAGGRPALEAATDLGRR